MTTESTERPAAQRGDAASTIGLSPCWERSLSAVRTLLQVQGWHPSRVVVLVPYAQMMEAGRRAWVSGSPTGFAPRFESSRNWAASLQPFFAGSTDWTGDMARDSLIAAGLLDRVAGRSLGADLRATLFGRLVEAARQLAPVAAACPPQERAAWAEALRADMALPGQLLHWEGLVASLALTWVGLSAYATDVLWSDLAQPGQVADGLFVVPGFQTDPLAQALLARWGDAGVLLPFALTDASSEAVVVHVCGDAEDEAQRAAACVVAQINGGCAPVALVAQDRALTRRVGALLQGAGVGVRDETGWKLSTTHVAARLMALLRAADPHARTDDVLDWLKHLPPDREVSGIAALEHEVRSHGLAAWSSVLNHPVTGPLVPEGERELLAGLRTPRPLHQWSSDLAAALQRDGWWGVATGDAAGQRVIEVLRLQDGAARELAALEAETAHASSDGHEGRRWSFAAFSDWVRNALEAASFQPIAPREPQVVVLPMAQLLGRDFAAVVVPGCDEVNLPASPEPPGLWSPAQRALLGLPSREALAQAAQAAWSHVLTQPRLQLLRRSQQQGDPVAAAPWLQALSNDANHSLAHPAADPRVTRVVARVSQALPQPSAADLLPQALSASAYQDLRDCPYRFFALRQLRLQSTDEIETEPDKRDLGNWLHAVLKAFHEARASDTADPLDDRQRLDALAQAEAQLRGLSVDAGQAGAGFLPFMAAWPAMREGYLAWLATHEGSGPRFERAELSLSRSVGAWRLVGQLDRIDRQASPEGPIPLVIDYKTEPRTTTLERVKTPLEDTQIAFYAALLGEETVRGAYLSITDSREADGAQAATRWIEQEDLLLARDQLLEGLSHDMGRIASGHALPALGEGKVCDFCAARGLCRKDFRA